MIRKQALPIDLKNSVIRDPFWSPKQQLILDTVIDYQEKILNDQIPGAEKSHAVANFRIAAGLEEGEFYGMVFQDTDVAKWLEGVAYTLTIRPDPDLEKRADAVIEIIARAQQPDGYLNTYFTIKEPEHKYQNLLECHELYCAGHMMEAAVAYYEATGKDALLKVMENMAENIASHIGPGKIEGVPGHPEVEIGLMRMYHTTGKEKYRDMAQYFIDRRGQDPSWFQKERQQRDWEYYPMNPADTKYNQSYAPVRQQSSAEGHAVRAVYLFTAMADLAASIGDESLLLACETLWENIVQKRMYVTGSIGSTVEGEAFTIDYDLPNDTAYAETCAAIGMVFFSKQMLDITLDGKYADIIELELYNGILSGMQLDGQRFFYVNPLEVNPGVSGELYGYRHVLPQRPGWYACACCPTNTVRLITSLGGYAFSENPQTIFANLFIGGEFDLDKARIQVESQYPWQGDITYRIRPKAQTPFSIALRLPRFAKNAVVSVNGEVQQADREKGYVYLLRRWKEDDLVRVTFEMPVRRIYANPAVRADAGRVALMRGPLVYCMEGADNPGLLQSLRLPRDSRFAIHPVEDGVLKGNVILTADGWQNVCGPELYSDEPPRQKPVTLTAVPYYTWGNRGLNQMLVWIAE